MEHLPWGCAARKWQGQKGPSPCSVLLCVCGPESRLWLCPGAGQWRRWEGGPGAAVWSRPAKAPSCGEGSGSPFSLVPGELRAPGQEERVRVDLQDTAERDQHPWGAAFLRKSLPTLVREGEGSWGGADS